MNRYHISMEEAHLIDQIAVTPQHTWLVIAHTDDDYSKARFRSEEIAMAWAKVIRKRYSEVIVYDTATVPIRVFRLD